VPMSPEALEEFLGRPNVAVISTIDDAGRPRSTPVWFHWEDGAPYLFTSRTSLKWRNLLARPHAALTIDERMAPYAGVTLDGPVEAIEDTAELARLVRLMALAYYGPERGAAFAEGYRDRPGAVLFRIRPRRLVSWAYTEDE
jgi:PPOX class probable F420-dependent enzyme